MRENLYLHTNVPPPTEHTTTAAEMEAAKARLIACAEKSISGFLENRRYIDHNYQGLLKQYPDEWIVVYEGKVVSNHPSIEEVFKMVDELGIHRGDTANEFMSTNPKPMIL